MMITVVNVRDTSAFDYYVGRPNILGNPFAIGTHGDREQVIHLWKGYAVRRAKIDENFRSALLRCEHKIIACHCKPDACHGDTFDESITYLKGQAM